MNILQNFKLIDIIYSRTVTGCYQVNVGVARKNNNKLKILILFISIKKNSRKHIVDHSEMSLDALSNKSSIFLLTECDNCYAYLANDEESGDMALSVFSENGVTTDNISLNLIARSKGLGV